MPDREKVMSWLEGLVQQDWHKFHSDTEVQVIAESALSLLKEQEAKNVVNMTLSKDCFLIASCPKCNALLTRVEHKNYCGYCGQAVKWS